MLNLEVDMGESAGEQVFDQYRKLPKGIRKHTDGLIKLGARATKGFRDPEVTKKRGQKWVETQRKKLHI